MGFLEVFCNLGLNPRAEPRKDPRSRGEGQEPWKLEEQAIPHRFCSEKGYFEHFFLAILGGSPGRTQGVEGKARNHRS